MPPLCLVNLAIALVPNTLISNEHIIRLSGIPNIPTIITLDPFQTPAFTVSVPSD